MEKSEVACRNESAPSPVLHMLYVEQTERPTRSTSQSRTPTPSHADEDGHDGIICESAKRSTAVYNECGQNRRRGRRRASSAEAAAKERERKMEDSQSAPPSLPPSFLPSLLACSASVTQPVLCAVMTMAAATMDQSQSQRQEREENERERERSPRNARIRRNGPTVHRSFFLDRQMNEYSPKSFRTPPRRRTRRRGGREGGRRSGADVLRPLTDSPSRPGPACPPIRPSSIPSRIFIVSNRRRRRYMADTSQYLSEREREGREGKKERKKEGGDCFRGAAAPEIRRKSRHMCCPYSPDRDSLAARPLGWEVGIGLERGGRNTRLMRSSR